MNSAHAPVVSAQRSGGLTSFRRTLRHPYTKVATVGLLWLFGLYSVFLSPAPVTITPEMQRRYESKLGEVDNVERKLLAATDQYYAARLYTNQAKVWFWRFKSEAREEVYDRQIDEREAKRRMKALKQSFESAQADANAELGVWTEAGIDQSRRLFWDSYSKGKLFAQQQSFHDCLLDLIVYRNSDAFGRFISFVVIVCFNFFTGMITALLIFIFQLPSLIAGFRPSFVSGVLFFVTAAIGGISVIATFLVLLIGSSAVLVIAVAPSERMGIAGGAQRRRTTIDDRPHAD